MILQQGNAVKHEVADILDVFQEAAKRRFLQICKLCLPIMNDEMLDGSYKEQRTTLHHAAQNGHDEIVKLLLDKGTDIECENDEGNTPLVVRLSLANFRSFRYCSLERPIHSRRIASAKHWCPNSPICRTKIL